MKKDFLVTKSNKLIYSRYDLSAEEQKIILTIASFVQPEDEDFKTYSIKVSDFANLIGVEAGNRYTTLRKVTKQLMSKTLEIETDKEYLQVNWLSSCKYIKNSGIVEIKFSDELKPYLLQLKSKFTSYYLTNILSMKSKYSIRMYEILKSNKFKNNTVVIVLDELRAMLKCEQYTRWIHLRERVVEQSIKEINSCTDLFVSYEPIKEGRKIAALKFNISKAENDGELYRKNEELSSTEKLDFWTSEKVNSKCS